MPTVNNAGSGKQGQLPYPMSLMDDDENKRDELGRTPLIIAAKLGNAEIVRDLLDKPSIDLTARAKGGITALHVASYCGHAKVVHLLVSVQSGLTVELLNASTLEERFTALHMAASNNHQEIILAIWDAYQVTIRSQATLTDAVNAKDCMGWTPLHHAAWEGNTNVVNELLSWKLLDVNAQDQDGFTALHLASWKGHLDVVIAIMNHSDRDQQCDAEPNKEAMDNFLTRERLSRLQKDIDWENLPRPQLANCTISEHRSKITALHYAVERNHEEVVTELLRNSSTDVHLENSEGKSAFDMALSEKHSNILWQLLGHYRPKVEFWENLRSALSQRGFKNFVKGHESQEKILNSCGELLRNAIETFKYEEVIFLLKELEQKLEVMNVKIEQSSKTPVSVLHHAAFAGLEKLVEIITSVPDVEINIEDSDKQTPLHYAAVGGHPKVVSVLISKPACRANAEDRFGRTALQVACENRKQDVEKLLLERADVRDYVDRFYRNRQVYVDAANAMLLGAALIASVAFAGWLQPPAGFTPYGQLEVQGAPGMYQMYAAVNHHLSMRVFWIFNSLSFFCAVATVIAGAGACLPTLDVFIGQEVRLVKRTLVATSTLLVFSVVFILGAFGAAGYASLPPFPKYMKVMTVTVIPGVFLCMSTMLWFLRRLYGIRPTWWRSCERALRLRERLGWKSVSVRDLFRKPHPEWSQ